MASILLIEDNQKLAQLIERYISPHGFQFEHIQNAASLNKLSAQKRFDLIICDVMLPDTDGFNLYKFIREKSKAPLIYLTALSEPKDHVKGLELGAVDYIVKPISPQVLLARVKKCISLFSNTPEDDNVLTVGDLTLNKQAETVSFANNLLSFTHHEFALLWIYAQHLNKPLTREYIFSQLMQREYDGLDRTIDARTMRLRKKLQQLDLPGFSIRTVWGKGYLLSFDSQE